MSGYDDLTPGQLAQLLGLAPSAVPTASPAATTPSWYTKDAAGKISIPRTFAPLSASGRDPKRYGMDGGEHAFLNYQGSASAVPAPTASPAAAAPNGGYSATSNGRQWYAGAPYGMSHIDPSLLAGTSSGNSGPGASSNSPSAGTNDSSTHGDHSANPGGFSSKGIGEGLATFGPNALGVATFGVPAAVGLGYGVANNTPSLGFMSAIADALGIGTGGGDSDGFGGPNGDAGIGGQSTSDGSQGDTAARGGLITRHYAASGLVNHPTPGRADAVRTRVPAGTYIVPADVVSSLGQGNTAAGAKMLDRAMSSLPAHGDNYARGGHVPVRLSGGEYKVAPSHVAGIGGGSLDRGADMLDQLVAMARADLARKAKTLPPPK